MGENRRSDSHGSESWNPSANDSAQSENFELSVQDLRGLQRETSEELSHEVTRLQTEKMQLIQDIANLQARYHTLQPI